MNSPTECAMCGSEDVTDRQLRRDTIKTTCLDCDATCVTIGDWHEWASGRTVRRAQAAHGDTLRRFEAP
jgi:hypothetical protein